MNENTKVLLNNLSSGSFVPPTFRAFLGCAKAWSERTDAMPPVYVPPAPAAGLKFNGGNRCR